MNIEKRTEITKIIFKIFILILFKYSKLINCQNEQGNQNDVKTAYNDNYFNYRLNLGIV